MPIVLSVSRDGRIIVGRDGTRNHVVSLRVDDSVYNQLCYLAGVMPVSTCAAILLRDTVHQLYYSKH